MPNANTISHCNLGLPGTAQGASSSSEFFFKGVPWAAEGADSQAFVRIPAGHVDGKRFRVKAWGRAKAPGGAVNLTINLKYATTSGATSTVANTKTIATTGAVAIDSESAYVPWFIEADLDVDSSGKTLQGRYRGGVNNATAVAETVTTEVVDGETINTSYALSCDPSEDELAFCVTGTMSNSTYATTLAQLLGFEAEAL